MTDRQLSECCFQFRNWVRWSPDNADCYRRIMCANYSRCLATATSILNREKHAGKGIRKLDDDVSKTWVCRKSCPQYKPETRV